MDTNFFGNILNGLTNVADAIFGVLPHYTPIGLAALVSDFMDSTPILLYAFVNQFVNLTVPMLIFTGIIALEVIRAGLAAWQWIKNAIPLA